MAKCPVCNSRKGKRKCTLKDNFVCPSCCGEIRNKDACGNCVFFKETVIKRDYSVVPSYSVQQMDDMHELQANANSIEGALCAYDQKLKRKIRDDVPIRIIELLIDKYHFQETEPVFENEIIEDGFHYVDRAIQQDLWKLPRENIVKLLGVIRFVARRRSRGGREYLSIIEQYVGARMGHGLRALRGA